MKYNLLGQRGIAGERNPDPSLSDDVATYMYDFPPGQGENKGATSTNKPVAKKEVEEKKVEVALENPNSYIARNPNIAEKAGITPAEKVTANEKESEVKDPGFSQKRISTSKLPTQSFKIIDDAINTVQDLQNYSGVINFTTSQKFYLANKLNIPPREIDTIVSQKGQGPLQSEASPIAQLQFETDYIKNFIANRKKILEEEAKGRDTRSLEQKETDYIKNYLKTGVLGTVDFKEENFTLSDITGDINYIEQLNEETEYIKNYIDTKVSDGLENNKSDDEIVDDIVTDSENTGGGDGGEDSGEDGGGVTTSGGQITNTAFTQFNNIPENGLLWNVGGNFYIVYEVPGSQGELYEGNPMYIAYELKDNDLFAAGLLTQGETAPQPNATMDQAFFDSIAIVTGNTDQLTALIDNPFASFVETVGEQSQVAPWITDPEMIALIAEAAVEGREVSDAEWQTTNWYQTHNESEREWLRTYYSDPSTATQLTTDAQIAVANSLQAAGVSNAPEALINWVAGKYVSGEWSQTYTTEQINLFADPYATGKRDASFENYLSSTALTGVDRTTEREREVRELYSKWLGPTLGKLTDQETAEIAGRLRDDPDYQDQLVQSLKQSRLAAFSNYTNPELTYEDIVRPWRNLTTSVWGQTADETQGWWQEMVKSNDFATAQTTLREKGLEQDITQVTQNATQALQQALGQGTVSQTGVNV